MNQTKTLKTACRCAQFCMLRMSLCVVSLLSVHNGHQDVVDGVLVVMHTFTEPFVRELLYQEVFSLQ